MARTSKAKLPPVDNLASAVNYWIACGRSREQIAAEWKVSWAAIYKALRRGGYRWMTVLYGRWAKEEE